MNRAPLEGVEREYDVRGTGEPVMLVHADVCADVFKPPLGESALPHRYDLLSDQTSQADAAAMRSRRAWCREWPDSEL
jgi:hypothetical protein